MTVVTELRALTLTANAQSVGQKKGTDLAQELKHVIRFALECQLALKQVIANHPSGGGDTSNLAALNTILAELA